VTGAIRPEANVDAITLHQCRTSRGDACPFLAHEWFRAKTTTHLGINRFMPEEED
jgi:hypothetical protein